MKNLSEKIENKPNVRGGVFRRIAASASAAGSALMLSAVTFAAEGDPVTPSFAIDFDITEVMAVAQPVIVSFMPFIYVTAGIGVAFLIVNAIKGMF